MRFGLRARLLVGLAALTLAATGTAGGVALWAAESITIENERGYGRSVAQAVALTHAPGASLVREAERVAPFLARTREETGSQEVTIVDAAGRVLASSDRALVGTDLRDAAVVLALSSHVASSRTGPLGASFAEPIVDGGATVGAVRVVRRAASAAPFQRSRRVIVALTLIDAAFLLIIGALLLGRYVVRPIERLRELARRVAAGELGHTIPVEGGGEIADLTRAANDMSLALREHVRRLEGAREQLVRSEKLASIGRLAAGIAHEVGNPLAAIIGYAEILKDEALPIEERREIEERIRREATRIDAIERELLDYARPMHEAIEAVALASVVDAAASLAGHHQRFREVALERLLPADLPPVAAGASRMTQVLVNLFINAADAMGGRGRVRVTARAAGGSVEFRVSDDGPGVPAELRAKIFEPFVTTKEPGEGTGLGLAICHSIVDSYGGTITLDDGEAPGATFVVTLPAWSAERSWAIVATP